MLLNETFQMRASGSGGGPLLDAALAEYRALIFAPLIDGGAPGLRLDSGSAPSLPQLRALTVDVRDAEARQQARSWRHTRPSFARSRPEACLGLRPSAV